MIDFICPNCDEELEIKDRMAGRKIECVNCGKQVRVPDVDEQDDDFDDEPPRRTKRRKGKHSTKTKTECQEIAGLQKAVILCILINLASSIILAVVPDTLRLYAGIGHILVSLVILIFVFMLAVKVSGPGFGIVMGLLMLIPCAGLIALLVINGKATAVLKENGYFVGFFGVPNSEFSKRD